jgi:ABC-type Mn2+/Zn2+ transport system ATPase subunit
MDEPFNRVDAETRLVISDLLSELQRPGKTMVVVTHDLGRLEADFDGVLYLSEGGEAPLPSAPSGITPTHSVSSCFWGYHPRHRIPSRTTHGSGKRR